MPPTWRLLLHIEWRHCHHGM